jgi:pimeloyl-ACP methyl ester carboxylesterase
MIKVLEAQHMDRFVDANGIRLHCIDRDGGEPPVVLLPGLTANANSFDGVVEAGLAPHFRVVAIDLRGRGLSDKPATGYSMVEHAADVIGLMDSLGLKDAVVGGHSFGGMLAMFIASRFADRVHKLIILDSAAGLISPATREMIKPSLGRLGRRFPSWEEYMTFIKKAPFFDGWWEPAIENYYRADVENVEDGSVRPRSRYENIAEAMDRVSEVDWKEVVRDIRQPALLFRAQQGMSGKGSAPLLSLETAWATIDSIADCRYAELEGNHMTMLYGQDARKLAGDIIKFVENR